MNRLVNKKILAILAIWFVSGGLSFADTFDLTDELQNSLPVFGQALEPDLDEVREQFDELVRPVAYQSSQCVLNYMGKVRVPSPYLLDGTLVHAALQPLHERNRIYRI
ncbi:MAG TPA: hypothetical protein VIU63_08825 [Nitrospira sp.]